MKGKFNWKQEEIVGNKNIVQLIKEKQYGSAVAKVAKPTAQVVDAIFRTHLASCENCAKREKEWNKSGKE